MKFVKEILFLLLLMPMVGNGQRFHYGGFEYIQSLNKKLETISQAVFLKAVDSDLEVFKYPNLENALTQMEINSIKDFEELVVQVQDPYFPDDEFAIMDSLIRLDFEIDQIKRLGYNIVNDTLKAIVPLRYYSEGGIKPLFYVDWEKSKHLFTSKEVALIEGIAQSINKKEVHSSDVGLGWDEYNGLENKVSYMDFSYVMLVHEFTKAFKGLYSNNFDSLSPLIFGDSLFTKPWDYYKIDHLDSLNYKQGREVRELSFGVVDITDTIYELDFNLQQEYIELAIVREYYEDDPEYPYDDYALLGWVSVETFFCRKEDFLPLLPKWVQLLMK